MDWLLTVPLLLVELVVVLALAKKLQASLLLRLIPASALMIALGYPGEISGDNLTRNVFGLLSTIPFLYILYVLFVELTRSLDRQPPAVRRPSAECASCCSRPGACTRSPTCLPLLGLTAPTHGSGKQAGYSIADILAKALYGLLIYRIARLKSFADDPAFAEVEGGHDQAVGDERVSQDRPSPVTVGR